jgi:hypothetical protein
MRRPRPTRAEEADSSGSTSGHIWFEMGGIGATQQDLRWEKFILRLPAAFGQSPEPSIQWCQGSLQMNPRVGSARFSVHAWPDLKLNSQAWDGSNEARRRSRIVRNGRKGKVKCATVGESQRSLTAEKLSRV